jgi:RNA polymerase sigma factor (sigma-70 family)
MIRNKETDMSKWNITEKSIALRGIRKTDGVRYTSICQVLADDIESADSVPFGRRHPDRYNRDIASSFYVPLKYAYDLADEGPSPEDNMILSELKTVVSSMLESLSPREERVIRKRFGIGLKTDYTLDEVGVEFSVTKERVRQMEAKALRKLKHPSLAVKLRSFLDY